MILAPASDFADLVLHGLACLDVPGPTRLRDPRYLAWAEQVLPGEAMAPILADARVVTELYVREPRRATLHGLPWLHGSIAEFMAAGATDLESLSPDRVADPDLLRGLCALDRSMVEVFRVALLLAAPAYEAAHREKLGPIAETACEVMAGPLATAAAVMPELERTRVQIAHALGSHGRAYGGHIMVGVPGTWSGIPALRPVVLAMHERAVIVASELVSEHQSDPAQHYARSEWMGLCAVAREIAAAPVELREDHGRWLSDLQLDGLLDDAVRYGLVDADAAAALKQDRHHRSDLLASL